MTGRDDTLTFWRISDGAETFSGCSATDIYAEFRTIADPIYRTKEDAIAVARAFLSRPGMTEYIRPPAVDIHDVKPTRAGGTIAIERRAAPGSESVDVDGGVVGRSCAFEWRAVERWTESQSVDVDGHVYSRSAPRAEVRTEWAPVTKREWRGLQDVDVVVRSAVFLHVASRTYRWGKP